MLDDLETCDQFGALELQYQSFEIPIIKIDPESAKMCQKVKIKGSKVEKKHLKKNYLPLKFLAPLRGHFSPRLKVGKFEPHFQMPTTYALSIKLISWFGDVGV